MAIKDNILWPLAHFNATIRSDTQILMIASLNELLIKDILLESEIIIIMVALWKALLVGC